MAPPEDVVANQPPEAEEAAEAAGAANTNLISTILIVIAMHTEAAPLVSKFGLVDDPDKSMFPKGVPWVRYRGKYKDLNINLVWPGKDPAFAWSTIVCNFTLDKLPLGYPNSTSLIGGRMSGVDSVGTLSASLVTYASIQAFNPDLVINAGTAGGFKAKGASIGDVYLASAVAFHDRRIPIPVFDLYGIGARQTFSCPNILKELNLKVGNLSTGDSLDMSPHDETAILANDATLKDMEGAAVAYVSDILSVPAIFVKAVTDLVDGEKPAAEEFLQNLVIVTAALDQAVTQVVDFISGKCISDL